MVVPLARGARLVRHARCDHLVRTSHRLTPRQRSADRAALSAQRNTLLEQQATFQSQIDGFEIALIRNETLSPVDADTATPPPLLYAYTARLRWPAFVPDSTPGNTRLALPAGSNPTAAVRFDYSQKSVLFFTGTVMR